MSVEIRAKILGLLRYKCLVEKVGVTLFALVKMRINSVLLCFTLFPEI